MADIDMIFSQLHPLDAIRITGGEPFLREDLPGIVSTLQNRVNPHIIHITTNGFLTDRIVSLFAKLPKTDNIHLKVSINSIGEKHDRIMGIPGAFDKAINTVKALAEIKHDKKFYLGINQTVTDKNGYEDYLRLKEIGDNYGIHIHVVFAYKDVDLYETTAKTDDALKGDVHFAPFFSYDEKQLAKFLNTIIDDSHRLNSFIEGLVKRYYIKGFHERLIEGKANDSPSCVALFNHLRILPNGDVPVCLYHSNIVGNLKQEPFKQLWFGEKIKGFRKKVLRCPGCWAECEVTPNAVYSGNMTKFIIQSLRGKR